MGENKAKVEKKKFKLREFTRKNKKKNKIKKSTKIPTQTTHKNKIKKNESKIPRRIKGKTE